MSLEQALERNNELLSEHNELLRQVLDQAAARQAAAAAAAENGTAPKKRRTKAEIEADEAAAKAAAAAVSATDDDAGETEAPVTATTPAKAAAVEVAAPAHSPTFAQTKQFALDWMGEIEFELGEDGKPLDTPENQKAKAKRDNRKAFIKICLDKVGVTEMKEIPDDAEGAVEFAKIIDWIQIRKGKDGEPGRDPFAPPPEAEEF